MCLGVWRPKKNAETFDTIIKDLCEVRGGVFVSISDLAEDASLKGPEGVPAYGGLSDAFHPNDRGHRMIADRIMELIRREQAGLMRLRSASVQGIPGHLDVGWYFFAGSVFLSIIVADYQGPIIAIAFATLAAGSGILWIRNFPTPRFLAAGFWLIGIFLLGLVAAMAADLSGVTTLDIDLQRDVGTTVSYILFLTVGYYFAYSRSSLWLLLVVIAAAGLVISIIQLVKAGIVVANGVSDLYLFRLNAGRGSKSQFAALCACLVLLRDGAVAKYRPMILVTAAIVTFSMLAVLGRGLMGDLIILGIVMIGLTTNRSETLVPDIPKFIFAIIGAATVVVGSYFALRFVVPAVSQFIDDFFITKLENSLNEVSATGLETRTQIAANYRAFELDRTMQQFGEQPPLRNFSDRVGEPQCSSGSRLRPPRRISAELMRLSCTTVMRII